MKNNCNSCFLFNAIISSLAIFLLYSCTDGSITIGNSVEMGSASNDDQTFSAEHYADETIQIEIDLKNHTRLLLDSISGEIEIKGSEDVKSIVLTAQKRVGSFSAKDAQNHLEDLTIAIADNEDEIVVTSQHDNSSDQLVMETNYSILVPIDMGITVFHLNGDIFLTDLQTDVMIDLANGYIDAVLPIHDDAAVQIAVVNGGIDLKIPSQISAFLDASATNGSVNIMDLIFKVTEQVVDSVTGIVGDGSGSISLHVVNGIINIEGIDH